MFKRIAAMAEAFHNRRIAIKEVFVSQLPANPHCGSYVEVATPNGYLLRYELKVTLFDGVVFNFLSNKHKRRLWTMVEKLSKSSLPGKLNLIHFKGENFGFDN